MTIKIPYSILPEARQWTDGDEYELEVTQISHDKTGVTLEVGDTEEGDTEVEDDEEEEDYPRRP